MIDFVFKTVLGSYFMDESIVCPEEHFSWVNEKNVCDCVIQHGTAFSMSLLCAECVQGECGGYVCMHRSWLPLYQSVSSLEFNSCVCFVCLCSCRGSHSSFPGTNRNKWMSRTDKSQSWRNWEEELYPFRRGDPQGWESDKSILDCILYRAPESFQSSTGLVEINYAHAVLSFLLKISSRNNKYGLGTLFPF